MQKVIITTWFVVAFSAVTLAQDVTVYGLFRTGIKTDDKGMTYNMAEIDVQKKRTWFIGGAFGFPDSRTVEIYGGVGYDFVSSDVFYLHGELLADKQVGSTTAGALYALPVILTGGQITMKIKWQMYGLSYLPLDDKGQFQFVLERAQAWRETRAGNLGAGMGMYCAKYLVCQSKPFVSFAPAIWDRKVQVWYQYNARNGQGQIQVRFFGKLWSR